MRILQHLQHLLLRALLEYLIQKPHKSRHGPTDSPRTTTQHRPPLPLPGFHAPSCGMLRRQRVARLLWESQLRGAQGRVLQQLRSAERRVLFAPGAELPARCAAAQRHLQQRV